MGMVKICSWLAVCFLTFFFYPASFAADLQTLPTTTPPATVILKPQIRAQTATNSKYSIDTSAMTSYLDNMVMFDSADQYEAQPYILGYANATNMGGAGEVAYAAGVDSTEKVSAYTILKIVKSLVNPDTAEDLGVMAQVIGTAEVKQYGDPQTIVITNSLEHIEIGSRLIPRTTLDLPATLNAKTPNKAVKGYVLYVVAANTGVGKNSIAVINLGDRDGLEQGDLLDCMEASKSLESLKGAADSTVVPTVYGEILIYKVMEKVSLGFILSSSRPVMVGDSVVAAPQG